MLLTQRSLLAVWTLQNNQNTEAISICSNATPLKTTAHVQLTSVMHMGFRWYECYTRQAKCLDLKLAERMYKYCRKVNRAV